jgi:hypothetical protein
MKKSILIAILIAGLAVGFAADKDKTTIEFKLTGNEYVKVKGKGKFKTVYLYKLNKVLRTNNLPTFKMKVVFDKGGKVKWQEIMDQLEKTNKVLKREIQLVMDNGYIYEFPAICYRGKTEDVPEIITSLMGSVFQDEQGIQAIRHGEKKIIYWDGFFETATAEAREEYTVNNPDDVAQWNNYDKKSDTVLVMSDLGPQGDGTELYSTEIKRCQ